MRLAQPGLPDAEQRQGFPAAPPGPRVRQHRILATAVPGTAARWQTSAPMAAGDTARAYHALTSYAPGREWTEPVEDARIVSGFEPNVLATFPAHCKAYPADLPLVDLPRTWPTRGAPATAVLAGTAVARPVPADLTQLARVLHLSAGVVRLAERGDGRRYRFRAAGSAGGQFPFELYVSARGVAGLPDGVYWFDPLRHGLVQIGPAPAGEATTIVITGVPWRTGWRYAERGFRHLYWDAGAVLAQTVAVAGDAGLAPRLRSAFPDADVTRLVGADGLHEFPLAIVTFGDGRPAIRPAARAVAGDVDRQAPLEFPLVTATQHAGDLDDLGAPWPAGAQLADEPPPSAPLDDVVLLRSSTRRMDADRAVPRSTFEWSLAAALRGYRVPHFVAVHAVEGVTPGMYRWPDLGAPLHAGDLRDELHRVCLDQDLARDAAYVVIAAADLADLDDRGYRDAQLDAGIVSGRLHLAAFALGIGATGMTFLDSEVPALLGSPLAGLLFTCVGVPAYRHRPGGPPGSPITTRPLQPRGA
jgi:SagB-type dehydrogenase family enzyme